MEWIYSIKGKLTAALAFAVVLGVMIIINVSEQNNSAKIHKAIASIYADRLVVESYIFQYSQHLQQIRTILEDENLSDNVKQQAVTNAISEITTINELYRKTVLTDDERTHFVQFLSLSAKLEASLKVGDFENAQLQTDAALSILPLLSAIQLKEAALQLDKVNDIYKFSRISLQIEIAVLIVIALFIQALVFGSNTMNSIKKPKDVQMN